jgi:hypothetical protein
MDRERNEKTEFLQYVSGKRDKLCHDCANKSAQLSYVITNLIYILDFASRTICSEVIP